MMMNRIQANQAGLSDGNFHWEYRARLTRGAPYGSSGGFFRWTTVGFFMECSR